MISKYTLPIISKILNLSPVDSRDDIDAYDITILKYNGEPAALAQTMFFKLCAEGYLEPTYVYRELLFKRTDKSPNNLLPIEQSFLAYFNTPGNLNGLVSRQRNLSILNGFIKELKKRLTYMGFIKSTPKSIIENTIRMALYGIMISLGLTKLFLGISNNKPVKYLLIELIIVSVIFFYVTILSKT
ncbi:MAG TPA: TIGR04222 domain-containing membrane protein, partial [Acetivibrio sp.]|nr:TIGR04222 domain-containing membrane protein [Acetivibrio sp.]